MQHAFLKVKILKDKGKENSDAKKQELKEVCTSSSQRKSHLGRDQPEGVRLRPRQVNY